MRARVHICGVLFVDVHVLAAFGARTPCRLRSKHVLERDASFYMAFHPDGTHMAMTSEYAVGFEKGCVNVFTLPDFKFVGTLGTKGTGEAELISPHGLCFTEAGSLLVADQHYNNVQHWTVDSKWIESYPVRSPQCIASRNNIVAAGCANYGVCVFSLDNNSTNDDDEWWISGSVSAMAFVDASTLAVARYQAEMIGLYTLEGTLKRQLASNILSFSLSVSEDGYLLSTDWRRKRIRVFSMDGPEFDASPIAAHKFEIYPCTIALCAGHAYVFETSMSQGGSRVCVFEVK